MQFSDKLRRASGVSLLVLSAMLTNVAIAQCQPDPPVTGGTTICDGADNDGIVITSENTSISLSSGARISSSSSDAILVQRAHSGVYSSTVLLNIDGHVEGIGHVGVRFDAASPAYASDYLGVVVGSGGRIDGSTGILLSNGPDNTYASMNLSVDNGGSISGTDGYAIRDDTANTAYAYISLVNHQYGVMGAISGKLTQMTNDGLIDGGVWSAIDGRIGDGYGPKADLKNYGIIRSNSASATIANLGAGAVLVNTGTIANDAGGTAIEGYYYSVDNQGDGIIKGGIIATGATGSLQLTNAGVIDGNVITRALFSAYYSTTSIIDSRLGTINGDLLLGGSHDLLIATFDPVAGLRTGVSGRVDGGEGNDTIDVRFEADSIINQRIALPGFEQVRIAAMNTANVALVDGFVANAPLFLTGNGIITNQTRITLREPNATIWAGDNYSYSLTFRNEGGIDAANADPYMTALSFGQMTFDNSGSINVQGNALQLYSTKFTNEGDITSTKRTIYFGSGSMVNSGTIRSTGDIALHVDTYSGQTLINKGLINGAAVGVLLNGSLNNSGTISSSKVAVAMTGGGLMNEAGGVISGGTLAIGPQNSNYSVYDSMIANAGTINGTVNLASNSIYGYGNSYIALQGGILNGDLILSISDTLAVSLPGSSGTVFDGFNGTIYGNGASLRYMAATDTSATLDRLAGFGAVSYEVAQDATLFLSASTTQSDSLVLAGKGTVDLAADFNFAEDGLLNIVDGIRLPGANYNNSVLLVRSRGALTATRSTTGSYPSYGAMVALGYENSFINDGTITFQNFAISPYNYVAAISRGLEVTNNGIILVDGAAAISDAGYVYNNGLITEFENGTTSVGVVTSYLTNNGSISMNGRAVVADFNTTNIINNGVLRSTNGIAIAGYGSLALVNGVNGVIEGKNGAIQVSSGGSIRNAGIITGTVDMAYSVYGRGYANSLYISDGGMLNGDLLFGAANDIFLSKGPDIGVSGIIDGGDGFDVFGQTFESSGTVTLGTVSGLNFEAQLVRAEGLDTVLTLESAEPIANGFATGGNGHIVNRAQSGGVITGRVYAYPFELELETLASFSNEADISAFVGAVRAFSNNAVIGKNDAGYAGVSITNIDTLSFSNAGMISGDQQYGLAVNLYSDQLREIAFNNAGMIAGRVEGNFYADGPANVEIRNAGTISTAIENAINLSLFSSSAGSVVDITNSGTIESSAKWGSAIKLADLFEVPGSFIIANSGTLRANSGGSLISYDYWGDDFYTAPASAIHASGISGSVLKVANAQGGVIEALGDASTAILSSLAFDIDNGGEINGQAGTALGPNDGFALLLGTTRLAGAIQSIGSHDDRLTNSGVIRGDIDLGFGDDVIVNRGTIIGDVYLRDGNDSFTQLASAILQGTVDGGAGTDSFIVDATGGGAVNADQFVNFERFFQIGDGNVSYSGDFSFDTIGLDGGTVTVAAGETLNSASATTITGGAGNDSVWNAGSIGGGIALAGGDDSIVNGGSIGGPVDMGAGNDSFTEQAGSSVAGLIDGGSGTDLYRLILAGDRSGIVAQTGFEQLSVEGQGTLTLALAQGYDLISLLGTNINLTTNGAFVGQILGSAAQEQLRLTGDSSNVLLGGGNDAMIFDLTRAAGRYDGGAGDDSLAFTAQGPVTLTGAATGFESVSLAGSTLIVTGQLGGADGVLRFGDVGERLDIAAGGRLVGQIDMAGGDDIVTLADGALWQGTLSGGAGNDGLILGMANARTLDANSLLGFEAVTAQGAAILTLANGFTLQSLNVEGDLTLASDASLNTNSLTFGSADNRFVINGLFAGSIDGGAGSNRILLNAGSAAAPVRFAVVSNIAGLDISGGYATVSGNADFGVIDLTSGRLVGFTGSTIRAGSIQVRQGATFGSAGDVIGNITVAGTLSPGASPGTMTVTGNVALTGGSTTMMEISPTISDKLLISGTLTIAQGAGLILTADQQVKPGTTLDLIIANGGISGSYASIMKPDSLFGFVVQDDKRIRLLGQFLNNAAFTPQVQGAIDYTNGVIGSGTASDGLIDALPVLATAAGVSNAAAFARLTAEPYASATQMGVENGLTIANATRSIARLSGDDAPRAFSIGQYLGGLGRIAAGNQSGLSASRSRSYGLLGGLGIGTDRWSIAGFGGYLDSRQTLQKLGSQTDADGWFAGVGSSYAVGALRFDATLAYHQLDADTDRLTPDGGKAHGRFRLKNWVGDLSLSYEATLGSDWAAQPDVGLTYIATTRTGLREGNGSVWALDVAKDKHDALFADGGIAFGRSRASDASFRPFVRLGVQYQLTGRSVEALAGFAGSNQGLLSLGVRRGGLAGSVSGGAEMRVSSALSLFANAAQTYSEGDRRASANVGLKFAF
ncbi:autotransporter outer membrane beta-barrel domain-containing protein [Sphingobium sp. YR768]|uniref:autotransporter outer membrane beta-barrel domain-containing protein n=1 Tax=Sphingobium sp. YR768 TaxID=1884365 RepID=UPI0008AFE78D|nr:autotransporter outer membrane beta-barrel domain-containing protein [Sphingobium sp. YR768]SES21190.1 Uncharacterized conserved protein, contains a C-terminal beta-barrel porin domain [Sphingobium sp. YR768]